MASFGAGVLIYNSASQTHAISGHLYGGVMMKLVISHKPRPDHNPGSHMVA